MINTQGGFNIHSYIDMFIRRIGYVIVAFVLVNIGTIAYLMTAPKYYKAETKVLVTPQKVPENIIRSTVTSGIQERIQTISQEILSQTHLEHLIREFSLYPNETSHLPLEQVVGLMRANIQLNVKSTGDRSGGGYFTISYTGENPSVLAKVANKIASMFIEENLKFREQQAQGTVEFLESELSTTKEKLEKKEEILVGFKRQHLYELPEQRDANLKVLDQLMVNQQRVGDGLKATEDRKLVIQNKLADLEMGGGSPGYMDDSRSTKDGNSMPGSRLISPQEQKLIQLKTQLSDLEAKYKANHPDILIIRKKINDLEAVIKTGQAQKGREENAENGRTMVYYEALKKELAPLDREIARLRAEEVKINAMISDYRARIEKTPTREITLGQILQDFNQTKETYQTLMRKKEEAQQAENMERRQKGEQFKMVDPARVPSKPFKPDFQKVLLIGLLAGLGGGLGLAFLREQMDRSFREAEDVEGTLGLKVLANIPRIEEGVGQRAA